MRILLTNDDGINAPGLDVLERIARQLSDDVTIVAPEFDQSGVAHSLSLSDPLRLRELGPKKFALRGTPTDCVLMGVRKILFDRKPDLLLSGVNRGHNVGEDITYSGTVAGALEGAILGVPSMALSQSYTTMERRYTPFWDTAETHAPKLIRKLLSFGLAPPNLLNINFPDCPPDEVQGVAITRQGFRGGDLFGIETRIDARGQDYHWVSFQRDPFTPGAGCDLDALARNTISITPLQIDMTNRQELDRLSALLS